MKSNNADTSVIYMPKGGLERGSQSEAPFTWRKVVPGKRVTLLAESTLPSVYMRKKLTPLPEPRANFPITTELAHALIVSP